MEPKTLRVFNVYFPYDYRALEADIRDRAKNGWKLCEVGRYFLKYTQEDTTGFHARIEVFCGGYEDGGEKKLQSYKNARTKDGWKLAGELDFFYFWYVPDGARERPVSAREEHNLMQRMVWNRELGGFGAVLALLILGGVSILKCTYTDFLTFTAFGSMAALPVFLLPSLIIGFFLFRDVLRQSAYLKRGEALPEPDRRAARRRGRVLYAYLILLAVYIVLLFVLDAVCGYTRYLTLLIPLALTCAALLGLMRLPATRTRRILIFCLLAACGITMFTLQSWTPASPEAPEDMSLVLTLETAAGESADSVYYKHTVSPVVPSHFVYTESAENGATAQNEYFYIPWAPMRRYMEEKLVLTIEKSAGVTQGDADVWDADAVYLSDTGSVLLVRGDSIYYYAAKDSSGEALELAPVK